MCESAGPCTDGTNPNKAVEQLSSVTAADKKVASGNVAFTETCRFSVVLSMLFGGVNANERCQWCQVANYLSCIPTSRWSCGN
uniref:Uncharacterized protein n=1 Tax=Leersia perrieri TaxID=77586 RepID=A0A0D9XLP0_9ORYZ